MIRRLTPDLAISDYLNTEIETRVGKVVDWLIHIGEQVVAHARGLPSPPITMRGTPHQPNYIDDTFDLRKSIGFLVKCNGQIVKKDFQTDTGERFAASIAEKYKTGIAVVVVAGERYASFVTAKGYDVLDSAETFAQRLIQQMLTQLGMIKK